MLDGMNSLASGWMSRDILRIRKNKGDKSSRRAPIDRCNNETCSISKYCLDQYNSCYNGVCCARANSNPYSAPTNPYSPTGQTYNNNPNFNYPGNQYGNNPYNGYNYPANGYDKPDPTIIVINASPTTGSAGTAYSNPPYPYNNNNYYNGYNPNNNNNGYNPYSNGYNPNNNNGYNPYSNGYSPNNNNGYNPYSNGYNPNNNNNNGYNPYSNGYNPNNNNGYNPYSNGYNPYSNNYNGNINGGTNNYPTSGTGSMGIDCSTVSMAQDQSACNSMQGQCSNPMVAQTCRQMCCSTQYGSVSAFPQFDG